MLNPAMGAAWREAGEEWKAVSPWVIKARMKMGKKQLDGARVPTHVTVISVYAPTFKAPVEEKKFYSDLQDTLNTVSEHDLLLVVGDFNARVGSTEREDREDTWNGVKGVHGVGG